MSALPWFVTPRAQPFRSCECRGGRGLLLGLVDYAGRLAGPAATRVVDGAMSARPSFGRRQSAAPGPVDFAVQPAAGVAVVSRYAVRAGAAVLDGRRVRADDDIVVVSDDHYRPGEPRTAISAAMNSARSSRFKSGVRAAGGRSGTALPMTSPVASCRSDVVGHGAAAGFGAANRAADSASQAAC